MKTQCGDWHLGWGFGGHNKIGFLFLQEDGTYLWKGSSQGRHGQKFNSGAFLHFKYVDEKIEVIDSNGSSPVYTEIRSAIIRLTAMKFQAPKRANKPRLPKQKKSENQLILTFS